MQGSYFNTYNPVNPAYIPTAPYQAAVNNAVPATPAYQTQNYYPSGYDPMKSYVYPQIVKTQNSFDIPWITDPVIKEAINKLYEVRFLPGDLEYLNKLGVNTIFYSGEEAVKIIPEKGLRVEFGEVSSPKIHAQWQKENNLIVINEKYKDTKDPAVILAISEAIAHELGHAKDGDNISSIQEEIDCLALNTLANRYHQYRYPNVFNTGSNADIINDGVGLYTKLFFDPDPKKQALVARVIEKYATLPLESPNHPVPLAAKIANKS